MGATSKPEDAPDAQIGSCEQTAARIRELNERLIQIAMAKGGRTLEAYERALGTLIEVTQVAGATQLEWLSALAWVHADLIHDVCTVYTTSVRVLRG